MDFELAYVPGPFAFCQVVFASDGSVRYINDFADEETIQACRNLREHVDPTLEVPRPGTWCIISGFGPDLTRRWVTDDELAEIVWEEDWHHRPSPDGTPGMWDGFGQWMPLNSEPVNFSIEELMNFV